MNTLSTPTNSIVSKFELDCSNDYRSENEIFMDNARDIAKYLTEAIITAIDNNVNMVQPGIFHMPPGEADIQLEVTQPYYVKTLEASKRILLQFQEYEICARINRYLDKLSK